MRTKSISFFLVILFVLIISAISHQEEDWKGTIEYENRVKVIKNPGVPFYGKLPLNWRRT